MKKIDFLAIGDITTDAFIKLKDAEVTCDIDRKNCKLCMRFGDKIPYERVDVVPAVGNSANASVSASRLGLSSALLTHLGKDKNGSECLEALKKEKVNTDNCIQETGVDTNYHYVLSYESERTILVKHNKFTYDFKKESKNLPIPKLIYLSSVAEGVVDYHSDIANWIRENNIKMTFQPGTYQMKLGYENLKEIYELTEYFFCNVEESQKVLKTKKRDIKKLLKGVHKLGPKIVFITDGADGAYAFDSKTGEMWHQPAYKENEDIIDRTGAGDSFSSTVSAAMCSGKKLEEALQMGSINSASVIRYIGARHGLLTKEKIKELLTKAPPKYKPQKI